MATEFKLPELGENIDSASVLKILVSVGDRIEKDQPVMELETDKATIELPSSVSGTISKILVQEGGKASVGDVVLTVESDSGKQEANEKSPTPAQPSQEKPKQAETVAAEKKDTPAPKQPVADSAVSKTAVASSKQFDFIVPELGENIDSATVIKILVAQGDTVSKDQPVVELETDKATVEVPINTGGTVQKIHVQEGGQAKVGDVLLTLSGVSDLEAPQPVAQKQAEAEKPPVAPVPVEETAPVTPVVETQVRPVHVPQGHPAPAAPSVRRLAREIGIDIHQVAGSGPAGRISIEDVKKHAKKLNTERPAVSGGIPSVSLPDFAKWGQIDKQAMTNVRRKTAENVARAWATVPQVTQFDKADITDLEEHRKRFVQKVELAGGKLTVTAILVKVVASGLKTFPQFNASIDSARNEIIFKKYYNIGIAVDTDRGLLVPVIRNAEDKNIVQLSKDLSEMAEKARTKKITLEDMQGGTFTITNLGGIGGTGFSPIVNYPEVAILGVSRSSTEAVYKDGQFTPRTMLPLSLSYDHRLIDGADAARFLRWISEALQDPFLLALEG